MSTAEQYLDAWSSTPIVNVSNGIESDVELKRLNDTLMKLHFAPGLQRMTSLQWMRKLFGRQKYCWTGSQLNWVWELGDMRIFVSAKGCSFEVREDQTIENQLKSFYQFAQKAGVDSVVLPQSK
jgi:hypothetical protein